MNIAILTMHRVINYGSFMQAFALKSVIENMRHQVSFRDFQVGTQAHKGEKVVVPGLVDKFRRLPNVVLNISNFVKKRRFARQLSEMFASTAWPILGIGRDLNFDLSADIVVIGSDEVFNYTQNHTFGYVRCLFGHDISAKKIVSYAASAGYATWDDVVSDNMVEELKSGFELFNDISVRDENTKEFVYKTSGIQAPLVIDPTLIYDFDRHVPKKVFSNNKYLLVYAYGGRLDSDEETSAIIKFARKNNLKIISIGFFHEWCDENIVVSPFELLQAFRDAEYVVTDTFHGTIFSLKFEKQFVTLIRSKSKWGSNSNKVSYLLSQFKMQSRIIHDMDSLEATLTSQAPYQIYRSELDIQRKKSYEFLSSCLNSYDELNSQSKNSCEFLS